MSTHRPSSAGSSDGLMLVLIFLLAGTAGAVWGAVRLATIGQHPAPPGNPFTLASELVKGRYPWPPSATVWLIGECVVLVVLAALVFLAVSRGQGRRHHVDVTARHLIPDSGLRKYTDPKASPPHLRHLGPGPKVGRIVR